MKVCTRCGEPSEDFHPSAPRWCRPCFRQYQNEWRAANKAKVAAYDKKIHYKRRYGLRVWEVEVASEAQLGMCAICFDTAALVVDHDHVTGLFRALLCQPCNKMLGFAKDRAWVLRQAAEYLEDAHVTSNL